MSRAYCEALARWMLENGFATGHGDNLFDLLEELSWQVAELRGKVTELEARLDECRKLRNTLISGL